LADLPVFEGCTESFADAVVKQARRFDLRADEDMELKDGGPLCIVENGTVRLTIGAGPSVVAGPGTVLNCAGFLTALAEAEHYKPNKLNMRRVADAEEKNRQSSKSQVEPENDEVPAYMLTANPLAPPPVFFVDDWKKKVQSQGSPSKKCTG
jgi:hypothetical protein